jgi:hypothetical protein
MEISELERPALGDASEDEYKTELLMNKGDSETEELAIMFEESTVDMIELLAS